MLKMFSTVIKTFHLLSLDVVLGAVLCNIMFWKLPSGNTPINELAVTVLGLTIWLIYILDRLIDNKKLSQNPTERHLFHQKYHKILWRSVCLIAGICGVSLFFLPLYGITLGLVISSFTGLYLYIIDKITKKSSVHFYKEPMTAILYVAGVWGTTYLNNLTPLYFLTGLLFLLIAFQNLFLFSLLEFKKHPDDCHTLAHYFGLKNSNVIILLLSTTVVLIGLYAINISAFDYQKSVFILEISMSIILLIINQFETFFIKNDRYRWVGDGIFLLPLLIIFR